MPLPPDIIFPDEQQQQQPANRLPSDVIFTDANHPTEQPDDPYSPEGRAHEAKMQAELRQAQAMRDAKALNAQDAPFTKNLRALARGGTFGFAPDIAGKIDQYLYGENPANVAARERAQDDLHAQEQPTRNFLLHGVGGAAGVAGAGELLGAAPVIGPAIDTVGNALARIPAITQTGRQAATNALNAGNAVPVTLGRAAATAGLVGAPIGISEKVANEGLTPGNVATGAAEGGLGGTLGGGLIHTAGTLVRPIVTAAAQRLINLGYRLTPGQTAGGKLQAAENKLTSTPVVGDFVKSPLERSFADFNRVTDSRALAPIGEQLPEGIQPGHDTIAHISDRIGNFYQNLVPQLRVRQTLIQDGAGLHIRINGGVGAPGTPNAGRVVTPGILQDAESNGASDSTLRRIQEVSTGLFNRLQRADAPNGFIRGQPIKDAQSYLSEQARDLSSSNTLDDRRAAYYVRHIRDEFNQTLSVNNAALQPQLEAANRAYSTLSILRSAVVRGTGDEGAYTPAQLAAAVKKHDTSGDKRLYAQGLAQLQDITRDAKTVYKSYPDSGTSGREQFYRGLVGLGAAAGTFPSAASLVPVAAASTVPVLTSSVAQRLVRNALAGAPQTRNALADTIQRGAATAGAAIGNAGTQ